jgi:hypothetical protein
MSVAAWQALGEDTHSLFVDPGFTDPTNGDFSLADAGAAESIGFVPFDWKQAGRSPGGIETTRAPPAYPTVTK